jgi:hypothetical protein
MHTVKESAALHEPEELGYESDSLNISHRLKNMMKYQVTNVVTANWL